MPGRWRAAAVVAAGLLVGILTAIPTGILALNVAVGVAWSNIHGGASDLALTVLPLVAIAVPFGVQALSHRTRKP